MTTKVMTTTKTKTTKRTSKQASAYVPGQQITKKHERKNCVKHGTVVSVLKGGVTAKFHGTTKEVKLRFSEIEPKQKERCTT